MCLGFPGRVEKLDELTADVDIAGTKRNVSRIFIAEELNIGDWVMVHAGFAMSKMDEKEAKDTLDFLLSVAEDEEAREEEYFNNLENKKNQDLDNKHDHNGDHNNNGHKCGCNKENSSIDKNSSIDENSDIKDIHSDHNHGHSHDSGSEHSHGSDKKSCCGGGGCGSKK